MKMSGIGGLLVLLGVLAFVVVGSTPAMAGSVKGKGWAKGHPYFSLLTLIFHFRTFHSIV